MAIATKLSNHSRQIRIDLPTIEATQQLGQLLGRSLPAGSIVLLQGDLGSGKTTLVNAMGKGLGIANPIISPTFVLVNEYEGRRLPLYHFDLYRLSTADTNGLAIEQYWDEQEYEPGIVAIEWAERLGDRPPYALVIQLMMLDAPDPLSLMSADASDAQGTGFSESGSGRFATLTLEGEWIPTIHECWHELQHLSNPKEFPKSSENFVS